MQLKNVLILSVLLSVVCFIAAQSDVVELTAANFDEVVQNTPNILIEFYAPWCGHCKNLAPEYEKAATELKAKGVTLAKIDGSAEQAIAQQYGIKGFPTLFYFKSFEQGKIEYDGERNAAGIVNWCLKKSLPPVTVLASADAHKDFIAQEGTQLVAFYDAESEEFKAFEAAAKDGRADEFQFGAVTDAETRKALGVESGIKMYKGEEVLSFEGTADKESVVTWVLSNGYPAIQILTNNIFKRAFKDKTPVVVVFPGAEADTTEALTQYTEVATGFNTQVIFTIAESGQHQLAERWGASGKKFPTAILITFKPATGNPKLIALDETLEVNPEAVKTFIADGLEGKAKAFRKSEEVPAEQAEGAFVLVGKNFEEVVFDETKDVLVEFYAPWCGHCKKLAPIYDQLAEAFAQVPSVLIAKIDATANGYPDVVDVNGFPTLYFFPSNNKDTPIIYEGDRSFESLREFILKNKAIAFDETLVGAADEEGEDDKDEL
jgi:protein disulfide-isomerase A1